MSERGYVNSCSAHCHCGRAVAVNEQNWLNEPEGRAAAARRRTEVLVEELSVPPEGTAALSFPTRYSRDFMGQFRICLWKQNAVYWRSPEYNSVRFLFTFLLAILFGALPTSHHPLTWQT